MNASGVALPFVVLAVAVALLVAFVHLLNQRSTRRNAEIIRHIQDNLRAERRAASLRFAGPSPGEPAE